MSQSKLMFSKQPLSSALLKSDANYFRLGAKITQFEGIDILYMPEFLDIAAGCIALWTNTPVSRNDAGTRLGRLEDKLRRIGASQCRIYDFSATTLLGKVLLEKRYRGTREQALIVPCKKSFLSGELALQAINSREDWLAKLKMHQSDIHAPDGHSVMPERWVEMERHKHASGLLKFFLAYWKGHLCGTVGVMYENEFLRMKNLYVHPNWRKQGIGAAITQAMCGYACDTGYTSLGMMALAEGPALSMYKTQGAKAITYQDEWICTL